MEEIEVRLKAKRAAIMRATTTKQALHESVGLIELLELYNHKLKQIIIYDNVQTQTNIQNRAKSKQQH